MIMEILSLPTIRLRFYFRARQPIKLPWYKGATFRGAFGQTFARTVCIYPRQECAQQCPLENQCPYSYIFDTPNTGNLPGFDSPKAPSPFVIEPPLTDQRFFRPGERFTMDLIVIGKAIDYLPYFVYVFDRMGEVKGVGKWLREGFGRYELEKVTRIRSADETLVYRDKKIFTSEISAIPGERETTLPGENSLLKIKFHTPTRLKHNGILVEKSSQSAFTFEMLLKDISWRAYLLSYFHHPDGFSQHGKISPYQPPLAAPVEVVHKSLRWRDWYHYSNRTRTRVPTGGFTGDIVFRGAWQPFYPLIKVGEKIHIGKATTFGLGKFTASVVDAL